MLQLLYCSAVAPRWRKFSDSVTCAFIHIIVPFFIIDFPVLSTSYGYRLNLPLDLEFEILLPVLKVDFLLLL
jgi:hypothetical protein